MTKRIGDVVHIEPEAPAECELCAKVAELRPYGPKGERICFACGQKNPAATQAAFDRLLKADQARADLIAEIACEISENEDVVAMTLDAYDARRGATGAAGAAAPALIEALAALVAMRDREDRSWQSGEWEAARSALLLANTGGTENG